MKALIASIAFTVSAAVGAQPAPPPPPPLVSTAGAAVDADRLAAAKPVIDKLWPLGTYRRLMDGTMSKMMDTMMGQMFAMKAGDMLPPGSDREKAGERTMGEIAETADPNFRERMRLSTDVMFREMLPLMDKIEPTIRESMVRIYARKFTTAQLGDLRAFLGTPTGEAYAREWMLSFMDPEIMTGMQAFVPELMKEMPAIMKKVEAATAHLPPPPKPKGRRQ